MPVSIVSILGPWLVEYCPFAVARGDITREAVLEALGRFDEVGASTFFELYGFGPARDYVILHEGKEYPSKAIYGAAYEIAHPDMPSLRHGALRGGLSRVVPELEELGYEICDQREDTVAGRAGWLFQANPKRYDIYSALRRYSEMSWTVSQHRADIRVGDDVYIWASGPDGGIIGAGVILDSPAERDPAYVPEEGELWAEGASPEPGGWEVPIEVGRLDPSIPRSEVLAHDVLKDMGIIRAPQMTNYPLTQEEHDAVRALVAAQNKDHEDDSLEALVAKWRSGLGEPWPTSDARRHQEMRERFAEMLVQERLDPDSFDIALFRQFTVGNYGGPGPQSRLLAYLKETGEVGQKRLLNTFDHLLYSDGPVEQRLDDVLDHPDWKVSGLGESLAVKALAVTDPARFIPLFVFWSAGGHGKLDFMRIPALRLEPLDESALTRGEKAVRSNDALRKALQPYLADDTHAMSYFLWWLHAREPAAARVAGSATETTPEDLGRLADRLMMPHDWLEEVIELLQDKRQVIFYGPPGTGKTYIAREIQRFLAPDLVDRVTVQFHPSYSYEDFVEGYRPVGGSDGQPPSFQIERGPLLELAERAQETGTPAVLLIDEINRGNLAKVFGELYYLLEYRDTEDTIKLQYSEALQILPESLYIIGTMNTADRSIALVDAALRRRFHFVPFYPDTPPIDGLLRRWLKATSPSMLWVADVVDCANAKLDRHLQIGPSHFMRQDLTEKWVRRIWTYTVLPYIEEQYFDDHDQMSAFGIDVLRDPSTSGAGAPSSEHEEVIVDEDIDAHGVDASHPPSGA